jgi:hypothetical protein
MVAESLYVECGDDECEERREHIHLLLTKQLWFTAEVRKGGGFRIVITEL